VCLPMKVTSQTAAAPTTTGVAKDWESRLHISQVRTILEYNVIRRSL